MNPTKSTPTVPPFAKNGEAPNSAIRFPVTVGQRVSAPAVIALRDISYVMECVRGGKFESTDLRPVIETIRGLPDAPLAKAMKANLPYFLGSVCEHRRSNDTVKFAHFAIFDLDHVAQGVPTTGIPTSSSEGCAELLLGTKTAIQPTSGIPTSSSEGCAELLLGTKIQPTSGIPTSSSEGCAVLLLGTKTAIQPTGTSADPSDREVGAPQEVAAQAIEFIKKQAIDRLPFIRYAFRSVRDGVKLIAQFDRPVTKEEDYRVLWQYLAMQVEHALGLPVDTTPDWSRACFFSYDPALLCNPKFKALNVPQALREAEMILQLREKSSLESGKWRVESGAGVESGKWRVESGAAQAGNPVSKPVIPGSRSVIPGSRSVIPGCGVPAEERSEGVGWLTRDPVFKVPTINSVQTTSERGKGEKTGSRLGGRDDRGIASEQRGGRDDRGIASERLGGRDDRGIASERLGGRDDKSVNIGPPRGVTPSHTSTLPPLHHASTPTLQPHPSTLPPLHHASTPPLQPHPSTLAPGTDDYSRARSIVLQLARLRFDYRDWIKCGMALYAGFGEGGRELWNLFLDNPHYAETQKDLDHHWRSFARVHTVTLASLFYVGEKNGCV